MEKRKEEHVQAKMSEIIEGEQAVEVAPKNGQKSLLNRTNQAQFLKEN